jgi:hypothetical protein
MKIKIAQRKVYYKYAEIEIDIPNDIDEYDTQQYLNDNEHLWSDALFDATQKSDYQEGFGLHENGGFTDHTEDVEWLFRRANNGIGGHL